MIAPELRPLSFGELLDRTFSLYRKHFWVFVGIMAVPQLFVVAWSLGLSAVGGGRLGETWTVFFAIGAGLMFWMWMFAYVVAYGATTFAVSEVHLGRTTTIRAAYQKMRGRIWSLIKLILSVLLRIFGCAITIVLLPLAALLPLWYALAIPALLVEKGTARQALKRSRLLTGGHRNRIFLIGLLTTIVSLVLVAIIQGPFWVAAVILAAAKGQPPYWLNVLMNLAGGIAGAFTAPLFMIALVLLYYDIRVRKEGYDLQLMMAALEQASPARVPAEALPAEAAPALKKTSVFLVIFLTLITFGVYVPVWFITRRKAINSLHSQQKLGLGTLVFVLVLFGAVLLAGFVEGWMQASAAHVTMETYTKLNADIVNVLAGVGGIVLLVQSFKVRRILLDHFRAQSSGLFSSTMSLEREVSFSGVATFFLHIYYLQYKINGFVEAYAATAG